MRQAGGYLSPVKQSKYLCIIFPLILGSNKMQCIMMCQVSDNNQFYFHMITASQRLQRPQHYPIFPAIFNLDYPFPHSSHPYQNFNPSPASPQIPFKLKLKLKPSRYNTNRVILACSSPPRLSNPQFLLALQSLPLRDLWSGLMKGSRRRGGQSPFNAVAPGLVPGS